MTDFFVSYTQFDRGWADWIAWVLEDSGFSVAVQAWDSVPGKDFVGWMHEQAKGCERVLVLYSDRYERSDIARIEWTPFRRRDPRGDGSRVIPILVSEAKPVGLLETLTYIDLHPHAGNDVALQAELFGGIRKALDGAANGRAKPKGKPPTPGRAPGASGEASARPRTPGDPPPICSLGGHKKNLSFVGREDDLGAIEAAARSGGRALVTQAIVGYGGMGKTQLAVAYAHRNADYYDLIWWIRCEERSLLVDDYVRLARAVGVQSPEELSDGDLVRQTTEALRLRNRWLLIFDNVPTRESVYAFLPEMGRGHVILTSRKQYGWRELAEPIELRKLPLEPSVELLHRISGDPDPGAATELAALLDGYPLALVQAASYVRAGAANLAGYVRRFRGLDGVELLGRLESPADYPNTVARTFALAFASIEAKSPPAADLLRLFGFLGPEPIPLDLLFTTSDDLPFERLRAVAQSSGVDDAIPLLAEQSLVERRGDDVVLHRVVQALARHTVAPEERPAVLLAMLKVLESRCPQSWSTRAEWGAAERLEPHALAVASLVDGSEAPDVLLALATLVNLHGAQRWAGGQYSLAAAMHRRALEARKKAIGPDHPHTAISRNNLALALHAHGDLAGAAAMHRRALETWEKALGPDHPDTAQSRNNLAAVLRALGDLAGAAAMHRRALDAWEKALGPDHPHTAISRNNLGTVLHDQGDLAEAAAMHRRALETCEKALGPDHPQTATSRSNLAAMLRAQGALAEAAAMLRRALLAQEKALGPDHPDTAKSRSNLAAVLALLNDNEA